MQRRALGGLFLGLAVAIGAVAVAALVGAGNGPTRWIVAFAAFAIAFWLASLAVSAFRR